MGCPSLATLARPMPNRLSLGPGATRLRLYRVEVADATLSYDRPFSRNQNRLAPPLRHSLQVAIPLADRGRRGDARDPQRRDAPQAAAGLGRVRGHPDRRPVPATGRLTPACGRVEGSATAAGNRRSFRADCLRARPFRVALLAGRLGASITRSDVIDLSGRRGLVSIEAPRIAAPVTMTQAGSRATLPDIDGPPALEPSLHLLARVHHLSRLRLRGGRRIRRSARRRDRLPRRHRLPPTTTAATRSASGAFFRAFYLRQICSVRAKAAATAAGAGERMREMDPQCVAMIEDQTLRH